jgi:putative nucleotidyltransferase with HDIG domain
VQAALDAEGWCPALPGALTRLFALVESGKPRGSELVQTLSADPRLARATVAHLARRAPRPAHAPRSLAAAVRLTRTGDLCTAALDGALSRGLLPGPLLRHARRVGDVAGALAPELGAIPHRARAAGLLHDIGRVGLPLAAAGVPDLVLTRALVAAHHPATAAAMIRAWRLPGVLSGAIGPRPTRLGLLVQLAEALVLDAGIGHTDSRAARGVAWDLPAHVPGLAAELGLSPARLQVWRDRVRGA